MTSKRKVISNSFILLLLHLLFWVCNLYPKHILEFGHDGLSVRATVLNLLYYILYFGFFAIYVFKGRTLLSKYHFDLGQTWMQKLCVCKIAVLVVWQLFVDGFRLYIEHTTGGLSYLFSDILTVLNWLIMYHILTYNNKAVAVKKKTSVILVILTVLAVGGCLAFDVELFMKYTAFAAKHAPLVFSKLQPVTNLTYWHMIAVFLLETWIGGMLIVYFTLDSNTETETPLRKADVFFNIASLFAISFFLFFLVLSMKSLIYQERTIDSVSVGGGNKYAPIDGYFSHSTSGFSASRYDSYARFNSNDIYDSDITTIYFHTKDRKIKIAKIRLDAYPLLTGDLGESDRIQTYHPDFQKYSIGERAGYVCENCAICYVQDGKPVIVDFKKLARFADNDIVIGVCEQLIGEGNIAVFEYGAEYLYKYDKDFIVPYLERYAAEQFNRAEQESLEKLFYKPEYIAGIATDILNN